MGNGAGYTPPPLAPNAAVVNANNNFSAPQSVTGNVSVTGAISASTTITDTGAASSAGVTSTGPNGVTSAGPIKSSLGLGAFGVAPPGAQPAAIAAVSSAGVVTPAATLYTTADQTALANSVIACVTAINALRAALTGAGITA